MNYEKCPMFNSLPDEWKEGIKKEGCHYPYYGVAPHVHDLSKTGSVIGSSKIIAKEKWPENFVEDDECPECGVYICPHDNICKEA